MVTLDTREGVRRVGGRRSAALREVPTVAQYSWIWDSGSRNPRKAKFSRALFLTGRFLQLMPPGTVRVKLALESELTAK